jgi:hypothetical protein
MTRATMTNLPRRLLVALLALALLVPSLALMPPAVRAAACAVTSTADSGANTLRAALLDGNCSAITISATGTIALATPLPNIARPLTIQGPGRDSLTIQPDPSLPANTDARFLVLFVDGRAAPGMAVGISGLTLAGGGQSRTSRATTMAATSAAGWRT